MVTGNEITEMDQWAEFQQQVNQELELNQRALKEITLMLDQSQVEMNKLAQRNTAINVHLQQVQATVESLPRADIKNAYDSALDAQQRLFVMRGQLEKLQSDQSHLQRYTAFLKQTLAMLEGDKPEREGKSSSAATLEMLVTAQEAERQRLSRAMHDGPAQALSNFILQAEIAMRLFDIDHVRAREELTSLKESAMGTFQKIRNFIFEMRPMMLDDLGLVPTVKRYIETFKEQSGVDVSLAVTGTERRLENYVEVMIFRAIQELLWNAARHSQGTQIRVVMDVDEHLVKLSVKDNGRGFSTAEVARRGGLGLKVIQERVDMVGGSMEIDSIIGQGTTVTLQIPTAIEPT